MKIEITYVIDYPKIKTDNFQVEEFKFDDLRFSHITNSPDVKVDTQLRSRVKTYICDTMDEDMKKSTISHIVDRVILNEVELSSKHAVLEMIEFLKNVNESLRF